MQLFYWDTDIGEFMSYAVDVAAARTSIMSKLSAEDAARDELARAVSGEPRVVTESIAVIAWHH